MGLLETIFGNDFHIFRWLVAFYHRRKASDYLNEMELPRLRSIDFLKKSKRFSLIKGSCLDR